MSIRRTWSNRCSSHALVLDVLLRADLPYAEKLADTFRIGLEASYDSIRANRSVDLRVYGSALEIPLPIARWTSGWPTPSTT